MVTIVLLCQRRQKEHPPAIQNAEVIETPATMHNTGSYRERVTETLGLLAIPEAFLAHYRLPLHYECEDLVSIGLDMFDREQRMERSAAAQWDAMVAAAGRDGVVLLIISAFRSFDYQRKIIERKLAEGLTIEQILRASALPGYSEHHTGRAIDIGTTGSEPLTEGFEQTTAFDWLTRRGRDFGFSMTYPRNNPYGIMFEPWHWMFLGKADP
jgi:D-alanyl-D-alanine carboxypeptidase